MDCAANKEFKFGVEAEAKGPRKDRVEGLERRVLGVAVVVVAVEVIARRWVASSSRDLKPPFESFWCEGPARQCNTDRGRNEVDSSCEAGAAPAPTYTP